jgi:hypothetical protein
MPPSRGVSKFRHRHIAMGSEGLAPEDCAGGAQKHLYITDPSSRQGGCPTIRNQQVSEDNSHETERKIGSGSNKMA